MGSSAVDAKKAKFFAGMKPIEIEPASFDKQIKQFLKHEAQLADLVREQIFKKPQLQPKPKLAALIRTYNPRQPAPFEKSEALELLTQFSDLLDGYNEGSGQLEAAITIISAQRDAGSRGSPLYKSGETCVASLKKQSTELKKTVKSVGVPKYDGKPATTVHNLYATASMLLTATIVLAEAVRIVVKWYDDNKGSGK